MLKKLRPNLKNQLHGGEGNRESSGFARFCIDRSKQYRVCNSIHYSLDQVPANLDAIIIGGGCGGLATAATLSKAGKKVLVLEQHDQGAMINIGLIH